MFRCLQTLSAIKKAAVYLNSAAIILTLGSSGGKIQAQQTRHRQERLEKVLDIMTLCFIIYNTPPVYKVSH